MSEQLIRRNNLLSLYIEFKGEEASAHPTDPTRGTDAHFAAKLQVAKASLSTMKSGSRPIGPKLARQFETICGKPAGWMDQEHEICSDEVESEELKKFLKIAKRAFLKADVKKKKSLLDYVTMILEFSAKSD